MQTIRAGLAALLLVQFQTGQNLTGVAPPERADASERGSILQAASHQPRITALNLHALHYSSLEQLHPGMLPRPGFGTQHAHTSHPGPFASVVSASVVGPNLAGLFVVAPLQPHILSGINNDHPVKR